MTHGLGEYIELMDCDEDIVRGHVTLEEFNDALVPYARGPYQRIIHRYGRWIHCFKNWGYGYDMYLDSPCNKKQGAFAITMGID